MFLNNCQIDEMASAALATFEMTADKRAAIRAAQEYALDNFRVMPRRSAVLLAYKQAMLRWSAIVQSTTQEIEDGQ